MPRVITMSITTIIVSHNSHGGILGALKDCQVVISGGMGRRLYIDFEQAKKEVFISNEVIAEKAVELYLLGQLKITRNRDANINGEL